MNWIMRKITLIIASLLTSLLSWGQGELTLSLGGGLNTILSQPAVDQPLEVGTEGAESLLKPGFMASTRFLYFFGSGHFGIGSGADFYLYRSQITLNGKVITPSYDETNGQSFDLIQTFTGWEEKERIFTFEFPLGAYYKAIFSDKANMVLGLGGKLVVPAFSRFSVTGSYDVSGHYPQTDVTISNLPHHGFVSSQPVANAGLNTSVAFSVYGELGFNVALSENLLFHIGLYGNYGVTEIMGKKKTKADLWDDYMVDTESILSSSLVEKANLLSAGVKLGVTIPTNVSGKSDKSDASAN